MEDLELETGEQQQVSIAPLKPIPPLLSLGEPTLPPAPLSSVHFDPNNPLGFKVMVVATTETFGQGASNGPKRLKAKKRKVTTPFKRLMPAIRLARENARLKLKESTASGYYQRPPAPKGQDGKKRRWRPGMQLLYGIRFYQKSCNLLIRKLPFMRLVREILHNEKLEMLIQAAAMYTLQEVQGPSTAHNSVELFFAWFTISLQLCQRFLLL